MKVLLDECVPRRLKSRLTPHDCQTVPEAGFAGRTNGELLTLAEAAEFQVFITMDCGIFYQESLAGRRLGVILLSAKTNQYADLLPLVDDCLQCIGLVRPREVYRVTADV